jgi:hypothetical protein
MRILTLLILGVLSAACAGDEVDTVCTKALYDPCETEHDCMSGLCYNFNTFQVCTQNCDPSGACPTGGVCENMICKPPEPRDCKVSS